MHAAPSVSYPVGRSAFAGALHAGVFLLALAAAAAWSVQADRVGWRHLLALAAVTACGLFALVGWLRSPRGTLRWDGTEWQWQVGAQARAGSVVPALDLQSRLLLQWRGEGGGTRWLWTERESAFADWEALRRAVYSRANAPLPALPRRGKRLPAGKPPAAEQ
jgi:toxin CptA